MFLSGSEQMWKYFWRLGAGLRNGVEETHKGGSGVILVSEGAGQGTASGEESGTRAGRSERDRPGQQGVASSSWTGPLGSSCLILCADHPLHR